MIKDIETPEEMDFDYFKFWINASNEHGVHSPFVFNLLTKGLYSSYPNQEKRTKKEQFIDRMIIYFQPKEITVLGFDMVKENIKINNITNFNKNDIKKTDFIVFGNDTDCFPSIGQLIDNMYNNSVFILDRRAKFDFVEEYWQKVMVSPEVTVTLDFYYFGVAFIRKEQLKQNFNLRLQQDKILRLIRV